ncbi:MAG TPA: SGNH/GDSL hydrolase family protein, partial [Sphingomicrobium sp.]|nr:SGNH/GDSL hydrolase family protein [Sphingomicrobium sp.]
MAYSGVYVFGDSLVDSGNALKLAETYNYFPFTSLPDGAPTSSKGYHSGNFTNGWTLVDLISNKYLGVTTKTVFPFGYDEPLLGISFGFFSDPDGNNLNFAYGGAQLRQGDEAVPDIDDQTDAFRDAVDGDADPNALYIFSFGANDVHDLVPNERPWADRPTAEARLADAADEYIEEILQLIEIGAQHILITGVPDIGIQPIFNGTPDEAARRAIATEYSNLLDQMIRDRLDALNLPDAVKIHYISWEAMQSQVIGTMAGLYGDAAIYPLEDSEAVFFDLVHPAAQVHALGAAYMLDQLNGTPAGEQAALSAWNYRLQGSIGVRGEVDTVTIALAANSNYSFQLLGISTLGGNVMTLADPMLKIFGPGGTLLGSNDDGGLGLDAHLAFTSGAGGEYRIQLSGVGAMTGNYVFQAVGTAVGNDVYSVTTGSTIVLEGIGGGTDTVLASVSYALNAGAEVELLQTSNGKGKGAINLTGNEFGQTIVGNAGSNVIEGKGGADVMTGGGGKDVFVLSMAAVTGPGNIDRITDYGSGDVVDISQILSVAAGINVVSGGYVRVTTTGLIQVDLDGGGNNWTTLSEINNGGAVTIRYLSGGIPTNLSLSRVSAGSSLAIASAVAAAGLASSQDAAPADGAEPGIAPTAMTAAMVAMVPADDGAYANRSLLRGELREAVDAGATQESYGG